MSIYRIDADLPTTTKFKKVNDMLLELNGMVSQGKFDINELDQLYQVIGTMRKYKRNIAIGNTTTTYTSWSHLKAESGYSIWKFTPSNYQYNAVNKLYMGNKVLENRGDAAAESATTFDSVQLYNGDSGSGYVNNTTEAGTELGTDFAVMNTVNDYLYLGLASQFGGIKFEWHTRGSNYTNIIQYYNGSTWTALATTTDSLEDGTTNFQGDGHITWAIPSNWATTSVNSVDSKYWIRISTTTNPITVARAYYIIPNTSVPGLLALSTSEVLNEEWAWCAYLNSIYVTIKNTGASAYEGTNFIASASVSANLQNFFVYNNPFTADYEDRTFDAVTFINNSNAALVSTDGFIIINATTTNVDVDLMSAVTIPGKEFIIKVSEKGSGKFITLSASSGETIDGAPTYSFTSDWECVILKADGVRTWNIISKKA